MDNDLAWLGGFIDGEGHIGVKRQAGRLLGGYNYYWPSIRICNTHEETLETVRAILIANHLAHHVSRRYPTNGTRPSWDIEVKGIKRCQRWLSVIGPYLRTKQSQAAAMMEFIEARLAVSEREGYSDREIALLNQLRVRSPIRPHRLHADQS